MKKPKHEDFPSQSLLADKEKQHDWLQSLSASNKVGVGVGVGVAVAVAKLGEEEEEMTMTMMHGAWDEMSCNIIQKFSDEGDA